MQRITLSIDDDLAATLDRHVRRHGYASRSEYWWWTLFVVIVAIVFAILDGTLRTQLLVTLWDLAVVLPGLAVLVRRLRDGGYHWAWVFIALVPLVGGIVLLVFVCMPTKPRVARPAALGYAVR